jgi:hypothetical protein
MQTAYQVSQVWKGGAFDLGYCFNNHYIHLIYQYNKDCEPIHEDNLMFRRRFFGRNFFEQSSIGLGYEYSIKLRSRTWYPSLFAAVIYSNAPILHIAFVSGGKFPDQARAYRRYEFVFPPVEAVETYVGLGLNLVLWKNFELYQKAGVGYMLYYHFGVEGSPPQNGSEFGSKYQVGLRYSFKYCH